MKYILSLRKGIEELIQSENAFVIGEDIKEPYGGAFKVTKGLSDAFPENIISTPMCEQGFFGMGVGMALSGCNVMVEVMFGDFITLMCDQMINHAGKFYDMYKEKLHLVLRCPSGGYRGYGATHSQSLEKLFLGMPGISVVAASIAHNPGKLLASALKSGMPTLFVENKLDYPRELLAESGDFWVKEETAGDFPVERIKIKDSQPDISLITYGGLVSDAIDVMKYFLYEEEINVELVVPSLISSTDNFYKHIRTKKAVVLEEGVADFGWGSEIAYQLLRNGIDCVKIGAKCKHIPASKKWEEDVLPMKQDIIDAINKEV